MRVSSLLSSHLGSAPVHGWHTKSIVHSHPFLSWAHSAWLDPARWCSPRCAGESARVCGRKMVWRIKAAVVKGMATKAENFLVQKEKQSTEIFRGDAEVSSSDFHTNFWSAVNVSLDQLWKLPHRSCLERLLPMEVSDWQDLSPPAL